MKILDRYILWSFLKVFFSVFLILTVIFVFQTVWLYISELAGKDLSAMVILKFLIYFTPSLMPLILPLTILVASIMTFGSFAEKYEFAAMKSAGISLQRAMRSLIVFIIGIGILAFLFANNVIPYTAYKSINLRKNIAKLQPSMVIVEGAFNNVGDINIKVAEKSGDNDQYLKDVIIHKRDNRRSGEFTIIKATHGELIGSVDSDVLSLVLYDGNYYDKIYKRRYIDRKRKPFAKSYFEEYTINIDLSSFNQVDLGDENYKNSYKMLNSKELIIEIDSLSEEFSKSKSNFIERVQSRSGFERLSKEKKVYAKAVLSKKATDTLTKATGKNTNLLAKHDEDTLESKNIVAQTNHKKTTSEIALDTIQEPNKAAYTEEIMSSYELSEKRQILNIAVSSLNGTIATISATHQVFLRQQERLNKFKMALYNKYVIGIACIVLFFVGAPLGAIIRKGGMGLPLVVAILLFLTYHFTGTLMKNSAENGAVSPFIASWLATFIMFPLSIFLTYRATTDQGFFNSEVITAPVRKLFRKIGISKKE